jgi:hypothetical protein
MQAFFNFGHPITLRYVRDRLYVRYGKIRDEHRLDPVSRFVRSFAGARTYADVSWNAFVRLAERYRSRDPIADANAIAVTRQPAHVT